MSNPRRLGEVRGIFIGIQLDVGFLAQRHLVVARTVPVKVEPDDMMSILRQGVSNAKSQTGTGECDRKCEVAVWGGYNDDEVSTCQSHASWQNEHCKRGRSNCVMANKERTNAMA
jgi:hypothetical protein